MVEALGYALLAFLLMRLAIGFFNWASKPYLPAESLRKRAVSVSVLIPARNEQDRIGRLLEDLTHSEYPPAEIIVYDDRSDDATASVVSGFCERYPTIRLMRGDGPPEGWLGKNHACHRLAEAAKGDVLLFLDADVRAGAALVGRALQYMRRNPVALLSVFPKQLMPGWGTRLVVPLMNWVLLSLLPLALIKRSHRPSLSAANGQFMMFRAEAYRRLRPHERLRNDPVEDIATIKLFKSEKMPAATLLGDDDITCRMYSGFDEAMRGFSKNVFRFFGGSRALAFLFAAVTTATPAYLFCAGMTASGIVSVAAIAAVRLFVSLAGKQSPARNLLLAVPQQAVFWILLFRALRRKNIVWKGRRVY